MTSMPALLPDGDYSRDMRGYGATPPHPRWPGGARVALQFVLNYEEGAENSVLHGDAASETFLSEIIGAPAFADRHLSMESLYEYGARAGVWRVLRLFSAHRMPLTIFAVAMALARNPDVADACVAAGHEVASHGLRWISYQTVDEATEREHMARAVETIERLTGAKPVGWYTGRDSPRTRRLVVEHGGFVYDADSYADDLPYWTEVKTRGGVQPGFKFSNAPAGTVAYAIIFHDIDVALQGGTGDVLHWIAWNIPASANGIPEGSLPAGSVQGNNLTGQPVYMGPGAPAGPRYHHYVFELYALNATLDLPATASRDDLIKAMQGKTVAKAAYVGRFRQGEAPAK